MDSNLNNNKDSIRGLTSKNSTSSTQKTIDRESLNKKLKGQGVDRSESYLQYFENNELVKEVKILGQHFTVGQKEANFYINHPSVSPYHCTIYSSPTGLFIKDTGGKLGIRINGLRPRPGHKVAIFDQDEIEIGEVKFKIKIKRPQVPTIKSPVDKLSQNVQDKIPHRGNELGQFEKKIADDTDHRVNIPLIKVKRKPNQDEPPPIPKEVFLRDDSSQDKMDKLTKKEGDLNNWVEWRSNHFKKESLESIEKTESREESYEKNKANLKNEALQKIVPNNIEENQKIGPEIEKAATTSSLNNKVDIENKTKEGPCSIGPLPRFLALCLDFIFTAILSLNLIFHPIFEKVDSHLTNLLEGYVPHFLGDFAVFWDSYLISRSLLFLIPFLFLQIISSLFFGVSLGQLILGIGGGEGFIWNRLGGMIRSFIAPFSLPFIVFDMPCLLGKRTFKEWITFTSLDWKGPLRMVWGLCLLTPPFIILSFLWPLLFDGYSNTGIILNERKYPVSEKVEQLKTSPYHSKRFLFKILPSLWSNDQHMLFYPNFDITLKVGQKSIIPYLEIIDYKSGITGSLKVKKLDDLVELLRDVKKRNYLFSLYYPNLDSFLLLGGDKELISEEVQEELIKLIRSSFQLNIFNLVSFAKQNGPFLYGNIKFREKLLGYLSPGAGAPAADIVTISNRRFLALYRARSVSFRPIEARKVQLIPLDWNERVRFIVSWDDHPMYVKSYETFLKGLSENVWWTNKNDLNKLESKKAEEWKPQLFDVIDQFALVDINGLKRKKLQDYLYHYYYDQTGKILHSKLKPGVKKLIKNKILQQLRRIKDVSVLLMRRADKEEKEQREIFVRHLNVLVDALEKEDYSFFDDQDISKI